MKNTVKILTGLSIFLFSCTPSLLEVDTSTSQVDLQFKHYEQALFTTTPQEIPAQLEKWAQEFPPFVNGDYKNPANHYALKDYISNELNQKLWKDWSEKIGDYTQIENELTNAFSHYKYYYPEDSVPPIYTYISGINYEEPIILSQDGILIGIDLFYGADYLPYKELQIPGYLSKNNRKEYITPTVIRKFAMHKFKNYINGSDMLESMIGLGKIEYFVEAMMPQMNDSMRLQFTSEQMNWCYTHEGAFWKHLTMKDLLFSKDLHVYKKYLQHGPFVSSLERDSPGRAGIYIGYQIVKNYMEKNSDVSLNELMVESDLKAIFSAAKYKP